ncbi:hypothetical protein [Streptomyces mirabilis]
MLIVIAFIGLWFTPETHGRFLYSGAPTSSDHTSHTTDRMADARQPEAT